MGTNLLSLCGSVRMTLLHCCLGWAPHKIPRRSVQETLGAQPLNQNDADYCSGIVYDVYKEEEEDDDDDDGDDSNDVTIVHAICTYYIPPEYFSVSGRRSMPN